MQSTIARHKLAAYPPDIVIEIARNACRTLEFDRASSMIELGYRKAKECLSQAMLQKWNDDHLQAHGSDRRKRQPHIRIVQTSPVNPKQLHFFENVDKSVLTASIAENVSIFLLVSYRCRILLEIYTGENRDHILTNQYISKASLWYTMRDERNRWKKAEA